MQRERVLKRVLTVKNMTVGLCSSIAYLRFMYVNVNLKKFLKYATSVGG